MVKWMDARKQQKNKIKFTRLFTFVFFFFFFNSIFFVTFFPFFSIFFEFLFLNFFSFFFKSNTIVNKIQGREKKLNSNSKFFLIFFLDFFSLRTYSELDTNVGTPRFSSSDTKWCDPARLMESSSLKLPDRRREVLVDVEWR